MRGLDIAELRDEAATRVPFVELCVPVVRAARVALERLRPAAGTAERQAVRSADLQLLRDVGGHAELATYRSYERFPR